jgi:hypothetical protein
VISQQFLTKLRQILAGRFNDDEIRALCFDLGIDYDNLPGEAKERKVTELIGSAKRHNRIDDLLRVVKDSRPDIDWDLLLREVLPADHDTTLEEYQYPRLHIPCMGRPEIELMTSDRVFLLTEANEWFSWEVVGHTCQALPPLSVCSSFIIDSVEGLVVSLYETKPARLRENKWVHIPYDHAILSLASTSMGVIAGDTGGNIALLSKNYHNEIPTLQISEPVLQLLPTTEEGIVVLGIRGGVWMTESSLDLTPTLKPVDLSSFDQPFALYKSGRRSSILLMGNKRLAHLYPSGSIKEISAPIDEGLRSVCISSNMAESYGVLTDTGRLLLVSRDLKLSTPIQFGKDESEVTSIRSFTGRGLLARTTRGNLYLVEENGTFRLVARDNVAMAFTLPGTREIAIIRWQATKGASVVREPIPV